MTVHFSDHIQNKSSDTKKPLVFITGASGGIGNAATRFFEKNGYRIWLTGREKSKVEKIAQACKVERYTIADLSNKDHIAEICRLISESIEPIKIAFLNAGIVIPGRVLDISNEAIETQFRVNFLSTSLLNKAVATHMVKHKKGHIINNLSMAAFVSLPLCATYSATKSGLRGFLIALGDEVQPYNIDVTCLYSNAVDTPMLEYEAVNGGTPLNFLAPPLETEDIINVLETAISEKKKAYFIPKSDTLLARLLCIFPNLMRLRYNRWVEKGEEGRQAYIAKVKSRSVKM